MRREDVRIVRYRGAFYVTWRERGQTRRAALRTQDRGAAEQNLIAWLRAQEGPRETVAQIVSAYLDERRAHPGWARANDAWKRLRPHFGHLRPDGVTRIACREYAAMRRRRAKDGTIIKELSTLRAALRWHDRRTPAVIETPRLPAPRSRYLTREEYRALRDAAQETPHCELFVVLAYTTAGRASAILELTWDRVDFARGLIRLADDGDHGNKGRATVPMTESARAVLARARSLALTERVVEFQGKPVRSVRKAFAAAVARAGLADVSPHVLRHSAAVHMAESGIPMEEISQYLGHSSTEITRRVYARFSPDYLRKAAAALE